jgi:hypothetical protein
LSGISFEPKKLDIRSVAKNIKPRGAISNIPKRCNPFSSAISKPEYLLMSYMQNQTWRQKKEVQEF